MGFINLFARKNKANATKQNPTVRELGISAPLPLKGPQNDPYAGINFPKQGGLKRVAHVRRPNEPPQGAHIVPRPRRINFANLDCESDLGLQGGPHRIDELYPEHEVRQADSGYGTDQPLGTGYTSFFVELQDLDFTSIGQTPASKKAKEKPFEEHIELPTISQDGYEYQTSDLFGSTTRRPTLPPRNPLRKASLIPSDSSQYSTPTPQYTTQPSQYSTQSSAATLIGSIQPNGKYTIPESAFSQNYHHIRSIGEGGFGKIDLHRHNRTAKLLILKTTRSIVEYINNVPAEVYIIRDILGNRHSNLPKLYHFNHSLAQLEYWMEYCDGGDLVTLGGYFGTMGRAVPEGFLWHILVSLSSALAFLHTAVDREDLDRKPPAKWQAIIHRDIKPDNIFLKLPNSRSNPTSKKPTYPTPILGDFGLATTTLTALNDSATHFVGTPAYQPPQTPIHSIYSDIWAVGAIVHYLATGSAPIAEQPYFDSRSLGAFECDPGVRLVRDITAAGVGGWGGRAEGGRSEEDGYSPVLKEYLDMWLFWEEKRRPVGLRGCLRAEAGRLVWLADGGVEEGVEEWEGWIRRGGAGKAVRTANGARGF
ncbi:MAG: hypothetical protein Q9221_008118 [Calogaya cf. arnoldii]